MEIISENKAYWTGRASGYSEVNQAELETDQWKVSIPVLMFQIRMPVEYHQRAFSFQISYCIRYTHLWWNTQQHMEMIRACLGYYYFYSF